MTELKDRTCVNCKYRIYDSTILPCRDCELHNKWEPRNE